ncbi:MAG: hypothetical protein JXB60_08540 [Candidatus Cloacimonetes bacterium]|nr:hypothetical protein [Candidatus Cloacimonadota bacterium]
MKPNFMKEKGAVLSMVVSMVVVMVSLLSSISLLELVESDHLQTQYQHDMIQEELLLRSESTRTKLALEHDKNGIIPGRKVEMMISDRITTYEITNNQRIVYISNFMGYTTAIGKAITSLVKGRRSRQNSSQRQYVPVKRYSEKILSSESLAQYQYFTDVEESENCDGDQIARAVKFWGPDELYGKVHSNDDIWIQNAGGGNNGGWPTFFDFVSTSGIFRHYPDGTHLEDSGAPMEQIFRGQPEPGWQEGVPEINFEPSARDIRNNGMRPFNDPNTDIVYVKIDGEAFESWLGDVVLQEIKPIKVYSWYPMNQAQANAKALAGDNWFEEADSVWTNYVPILDTIWTSGPTGVVHNNSVWVEAELWIEGNIYGKQTWGCEDSIFIVGDITYEHTPVGQFPDEEGNENRTDFFGLVSEERILVKYKHIDPETGEKESPNCNGIYMYGAFAAIGDGDIYLYGEDMNCHYEGIFTFEYQHPHGSTPHYNALSPYTLQDTLYDYVDLHKFIFPPSDFVPINKIGFLLHGNDPQTNGMCGYPYESPAYINSYPNDNPFSYVYPYGTDYPWYNPVWPESSNDIAGCTERGDLHIYGAIAQRRRGFVHRSGGDAYNHPNAMEWDLSEFHYDGTHPSTGYNKDYHYDTRFLVIQPPDYPEVYRGFGSELVASFNEDSWMFKVPTE